MVTAIMTQVVERLVQHLFAGSPAGGMAAEVGGWLEGSSRFRTFAETHKDKIRKKLRTAVEGESRRDVRAELRVAHALLADRRFELAFEAYGVGKPGPDFTVAFRGARSFNLEVTRPRRSPDSMGLVGPLTAKLKQLPPSIANVVLVAVEGENAAALDVDAATRLLRARADASDDRRGFYERYPRLSGVVVFCEGATGDARASVWLNQAARHPFADAACRPCLTCLRDG
jgi:hypothetical protein